MVDEPALQFEGEMPFGAADEDGLQEFAEGLVGDLGADPQAGDLLLVLDHPQLFDRAAEVGQPQPRGDRADRPVPGDGEVVFLDGEGVGALGLRRDRRRRRRVARAAGQGLQRAATRPVAPAAGLSSGGPAHSSRSSVLPSSRTAPCGARAREVADVGGAGDKRGRAAAGRAAFPQPCSADRVHL